MLTNNQCSLCHVGNNYTSTPSDCWSCHQTDYNNTTNPGHKAAGFAQTCNSCHTFVDWTGAVYSAHDAKDMPIYSGTHNGKWNNLCNTCHTSSTDYTAVTLTCGNNNSCHPQAATDKKHQGFTGYAYIPATCLTCHPRGTGGG